MPNLMALVWLASKVTVAGAGLEAGAAAGAGGGLVLAGWPEPDLMKTVARAMAAALAAKAVATLASGMDFLIFFVRNGMVWILITRVQVPLFRRCECG